MLSLLCRLVPNFFGSKSHSKSRRAHTRIPFQSELLEERIVLSPFYDFEVLAQTGVGGLTDIENAISINDSGNVAFVARDADGPGIYFHDGSLIEVATDSSFSYGRELQLNDSNQIGAVRSRGGTSTARIWDATSPNSTVRIAGASVLVPRSFELFEGIGSFASIANDGQLSFAGLESGIWEVHLSDSFVDRRDSLSPFSEVVSFTSNTVFRQMAADGDLVVIGSREGSLKQIVLHDITGLDTHTDIATTSSGSWFDLGLRPGISDDGQIVTFYGENAEGPGIFASVATESGRLPPKRIASIGNGISGFAEDTRISVNATQADQRAVTVAFVAFDAAGRKGIYTSRLNFFGNGRDLFDPANPVRLEPTAPTLVIQTGQEVFNDDNGNGIRDAGEQLLLPGTVEDVNIHDAVNSRDRGDIAFWITTDAGSDAVVRARSQELIFIDFAPQASFQGTLTTTAQQIFNANLGMSTASFDASMAQVFSSLAPNRSDLNGSASVETVQENIVKKVQATFDSAGVNVRVVSTMPLSDDFMHVFVGGSSSVGQANPELDGIASSIDFYNQDLFAITNNGVTTFTPAPDIAAVFVDNVFNVALGKFTDGMGNSVSLGQSTGAGTISRDEVENAIANVVIHEAGHNLGLLHLQNMPNSFVMNSNTDPDEFRILGVFAAMPRLINGSTTVTQNDQMQLRFAVGTNNNSITRPLTGSGLANLFGRSVYKMTTSTLSDLAVTGAVLALAPLGEQDLVPEVVNLGAGNLATILDKEFLVREGDQALLLASTDGKGIDVIGVPSNFFGDMSALKLTSFLGAMTNPSIRGDLFDSNGNPAPTSLVVFQQTDVGVVLLGQIGGDVTQTNENPIATDDGGEGFSTDEDTAFSTGSVVTNDNDPDSSGSLTAVGFDTTGTLGIVTANGDGTFTYDPNGQFDYLSVGETETDSFVYILHDGEGGVDTATVTIEIRGVNEQPAAVEDGGVGFETDEDTLFTTTSVLANDTDPDQSDALTIQGLDTSVTKGRVVDNGDGTFNYDPNGQFDFLAAGDVATDTFEYTVSDGNGGTDTATVTITITGVNDPPVANDDGGLDFTTDVNTTFTTGNVLANDTDVDGTVQAETKLLGVTWHTPFNGLPSRLYEIDQATGDSTAIGNTGYDRINSLARDESGNLWSAGQSVSGGPYSLIIIDPTTGAGTSVFALPFTDVRAMTFGADDKLYVIVDEFSGDLLYEIDVALGTTTLLGSTGLVGIQAMATAEDGTLFAHDAGRFFPARQPDAGLVIIDPESGVGTDPWPSAGSFPSQTLAFSPDGELYALDTFRLSRIDLTTGTATTVFQKPSPQSPAIDFRGMEWVDVSTSQNMGLSVIDVDTSSTRGRVTDNGDGTFDYDPSGAFENLRSGQVAMDQFSYTVSDGLGGTDVAIVTITINGVNDSPVADDDSGAGFSTDEDSSFTTPSVLSNDSDADTADILTVSTFDTTGGLGLVINNGDGTFNYEPNGKFEHLAVGDVATDMFEYTVSDGNGGADTATVTITIVGVNDEPTASDDDGASFVTNENTRFTTGSVLSNDSDPDTGDVLTIQSIDTSGTKGLVIDNGDGTFDYDPNGQFERLAAGDIATDTFDYTVSDGNGGTDTGTVTLTIMGVNDAPQLDNVAITSRIDENGEATLIGDIVDPDLEDIFTLTVDWGDGMVEMFDYPAGTTSFSETHQYLDDDPSGTPQDVYDVSLSLTDHGTSAGNAGLELASTIFVGGAGDQFGGDVDVAAGNLFVGGSDNTSGSRSLALSYALPSGGSPDPVLRWQTTWPGLGSSRTGHESFGGVVGTEDSAYFVGGSYRETSDGVGGKEQKSVAVRFDEAGPLGSDVAGADWVGRPNFFPYRGFEGHTETIVVEDQGNVTIYAVGFAEETGSGGTRTTLAAYDDTGSLLWKRAFATDLSGNPIAGTFQRIGSVGYGIVELNGHLYIAGNDRDAASLGGSGRQAMLLRYDAAAQTPDPNPNADGPEALVPEWARVSGFHSDFQGLAAFGGALYAVGWAITDGHSDYLVEKYDTDGNLVWSTTTGGAGNDVLNELVAIGDKLYAVGATESSGAGGRDLVIVEIDPSTGSIVERALFGGAEHDMGTALTTDGTDLYVLGSTRSFDASGNTVGSSDAVLLRYTTSGGGSEAMANVTVTVQNVAPVITAIDNSASTAGLGDVGELVSLSASFTDVGILDTHTAVIDWGDGQQSAGAVVESDGSGTIEGSHSYINPGIYQVSVSLTDDDTGSAEATATAYITGAAINDGVLQIVGTSEADQITINQQGNGLLKVHASFFDGRPFRTFRSEEVTSILVAAGGGDDHVTVAGNVAIPTILDGGEGNDHLNGGRGPNVILGGIGNDRILGGSGRDILIGRTGADFLNAGPGEDILIAGSTAFDSDYDALNSILTEWTSDRSYAERVANLSGVGMGPRLNGDSFLLQGDTVTDDDAPDVLEGASGRDWYFGNVDDDDISKKLDEVFGNGLESILDV